jgi:hypothetical protein
MLLRSLAALAGWRASSLSFFLSSSPSPPLSIA